MTGLVILRSTICRTAGSSVAASVRDAGWMDELVLDVEADDELEDGDAMVQSIGRRAGERIGELRVAWRYIKSEQECGPEMEQADLTNAGGLWQPR